MRLHSYLLPLLCAMPLVALAQGPALMNDDPNLANKPRLGTVTSSTAGDDKPRYVIRQDMADTGSNIRRPIATGSIPFDKRYDELTPEQKAAVKSQYQKLGPRDEPPFPVNGLASLYKAIATAQQYLQANGNLSVFVEIDPKGEPTSVSVLESPDPKMTKAVASILMLEKYKPALCDGAPCAMAFPVRLALEMR